MNFVCLLLFLGLSSLSLAAPYPATSSSALTDPSKGLFFHGFGFRLKRMTADWAPSPVLKNSSRDSLRIEPLSKKKSQEASISLHLEKMEKTVALDTYARKWMREYSSYGFEVLGIKRVLLNKEKALLIDLTHQKRNRQLRQAILQDKDRIAVVTCIDKKDLFPDTLAVCNEFLRNFEWIQTTTATLIQEKTTH